MEHTVLRSSCWKDANEVCKNEYEGKWEVGSKTTDVITKPNHTFVRILQSSSTSKTQNICSLIPLFMFQHSRVLTINLMNHLLIARKDKGTSLLFLQS